MTKNEWLYPADFRTNSLTSGGGRRQPTLRPTIEYCWLTVTLHFMWINGELVKRLVRRILTHQRNLALSHHVFTPSPGYYQGFVHYIWRYRILHFITDLC